jgi:murein DD-endopeptidase MepM/ murein hydrolase activator NlpD
MPNDYASYLREVSIPQGYANLAAQQDNLAQMLQTMKNRAAPRIVGGGGGGGNSGGGVPQYDTKSGLPVARSSGQTGPLPKMGGKVAPASFSRISQGWGKSRITYQAGRHTGMDFYGAYGSKIRSAAGGVVVRTGNEGAYGNAIHVRHKDGTTALYAHLSGITVKPGQRVKAGQTVGKMGSTGRASGTHLHFEIRKQDRYGGDINPRSWYSTR